MENMKNMNMFQRGMMQQNVTFLIYIVCVAASTCILGLLIKWMFINVANHQLLLHHITKESFLQVVNFINRIDIYRALFVMLWVVGLLIITYRILLKSTRFNLVQDVVLPRAVEFSTALRKIGVLSPKDQMGFVNKHRLPVYIAKTPIIEDETRNISVKLYPFSRGIMACPTIYAQNIGKRTLCLNADDYKHIVEEQSRKVGLEENIELETKKQEVKVLTNTLNAEMDKNATLQLEINELKMQLKTLEARTGKASVAVHKTIVFARIAIPLIERLKREFKGHKYTRPYIQSAFLAEIEQQPDMRSSLQKILKSKELILSEAYMKAIRNELSSLVNTEGGR